MQNCTGRKGNEDKIAFSHWKPRGKVRTRPGRGQENKWSRIFLAIYVKNSGKKKVTKQWQSQFL